MEPFRFLADFGFKRFFLSGFLDFGNWIGFLDSTGFLLDFLDFLQGVRRFF